MSDGAEGRTIKQMIEDDARYIRPMDCALDRRFLLAENAQLKRQLQAADGQVSEMSSRVTRLSEIATAQVADEWRDSIIADLKSQLAVANHAHDVIAHNWTEANRVHNAEINRMAERLAAKDATIDELEHLTVCDCVLDADGKIHAACDGHLEWQESLIQQLAAKDAEITDARNLVLRMTGDEEYEKSRADNYFAEVQQLKSELQESRRQLEPLTRTYKPSEAMPIFVAHREAADKAYQLEQENDRLTEHLKIARETLEVAHDRIMACASIDNDSERWICKAIKDALARIGKQ